MVKSIRLLLAFCIILFLSCNTIYAYTASRSYARYKSCLSIQRVLQGAIEMYNMDSSSYFEKLDEDGMKKLEDGKYIKKIPVGPELSCKYLYTKEYSENGDVYCEYHGGIDKDKLRPSPQFAEILEAHYRSEKRLKIELLVGIPIVLIFWGFVFWHGIKGIIKLFKSFTGSKS